MQMLGRFGLTKISIGDLRHRPVTMAFTVDLSAVPVNANNGVPKRA